MVEDQAVPRVTALGYVGIGATDVAAWETFATSFLGLELRERDAGGALHLRMDDQVARLIVEPGRDDLAFTGWEVASDVALAALAERLRAAGVAYTSGTPAECAARHVGGLIRCADPAGLATEIYWGGVVDLQRPFRSPRAIAGFETAGKGLGHVVTIVADFDAAMRFYRDLLGLRVSDFITFDRRGTIVTMAFMHCNGRHHSLAFMQLPSAPKRLSHLMFEVRELDDVGRTHSLALERGVPVTKALGRHTNDRMFSFYCQTPSGFELEYGWGGRIVDDATWSVETHFTASMWGHQRLNEEKK